ncbi:GGDEF domain-containing protein [Actinoplanes sp. Pm04-4]|uniref:GGDEF domain-containing protein n=1 Tax=Paractinoplanes pyxinae TaxID=2997416 RepID=A0ABT4BGM8_9ACTN|nr:GGDEF domain-containing protein [Actinoplanes pyxinae]MCY1145691.1 GGDEF domain-containing protein [Actinoplanes pyxinae]
MAGLKQVGLVLGRVVERQRASESLAWQATHDPVTALANRGLLLEHIGLTQDDIFNPAEVRSAVLLINIDRFRQVNDSLGHVVGDQVLRLIAERLRSSVGPDDLVARLSADEFVVLSYQSADANFCALAEQLQRAVSQPLMVGGHQMRLRAGIGISLISFEQNLPAAVLRSADSALRHARTRGSEQVYMFDAKLAAAVEQRIKDEAGLARAIAAVS